MSKSIKNNSKSNRKNTQKSSKKIAAKKTTKAAVSSANETIQNRILTIVNRKGSWEGTMTELNTALLSGRRTTPSDWPGSPSVLRRVVNSVLPSLRKAGVVADFGRKNDSSRTRFVSFAVR